jgi:ABC-type sugar transport system substrate-binding protein
VKRLVLAVAVAAAAVTTAAPAMARPDPVCILVPDLDGHVWPFCLYP